MSYRLFTLTFSFSLCLMAGQLMGLENSAEEWGGNFEASHAVRVVTQGDLFTLSIPDTTGLSGKISVPTLNIVDLPAGEETFLKKNPND